MPDITMCMKEDCPKKHTCYRQTAKPDILQSYSYFEECTKELGYPEYWGPLQEVYRRKEHSDRKRR